MSLLSLFRGSAEKQIAKLRKKVKEPHGDASVRVNAAYKLYQMGTSPAIRALLERFTITVSPSTVDEEEKQQVLGWLVSFGEQAVEPLVSFLKRERQVYWPIRILRRILSREELVTTINEVLLYHWENPPASTQPQAQMIRAVLGEPSKELGETVSLYLEETDDDVQIAALDFLFEGSNEAAPANRGKILECFLAAEDRLRVRHHILDRLLEKRWSVKGYRPRMEAALPPGYSLSRDGRVKRLGDGRLAEEPAVRPSPG